MTGDSDPKTMTTDELRVAAELMSDRFDAQRMPFILAEARLLGAILAKTHSWPEEDDATDSDVLMARILRELTVEGAPDYPNRSIHHLFYEPHGGACVNAEPDVPPA